MSWLLKPNRGVAARARIDHWSKNLAGVTPLTTSRSQRLHCALCGKKLQQFQLLYNILERLDFEQAKNPLSPIISYIESHIGDNSITNKLLAQKMNISEVYLRKLFLSNLGITPKQYILELRINKAKQLLVYSNYSVTKISEKCGFSSPYHFCRAFKSKTGIPPTEYARFNKIYEI